MEIINKILNFIMYGYGKWFIVIAALVVVVVLLCVLVAKTSAANKSRNNLMKKLGSSIDTLGGNVADIKEDIKEEKSEFETYISSKGSNESTKSVDAPSESAKPKHKRVVGIDNRIEALKVEKEDESEDVVTIESILDGTATDIYKRGLAKDSAKAEKKQIGNWLKDVKPEHKTAKSSFDATQASEPSYVSKFASRDCGTDKNGNTYTEEQLRKQIR